jgi:hypothetical protein
MPYLLPSLPFTLCITSGITLTTLFAIGPDSILIELDTTDIRTLQTGIFQVRAVECHIGEIRPGQPCALKIRTTGIHNREIRAVQIRKWQLGNLQIRPGEIGTPHNRFLQIAGTEVRPAQVRAFQIETVQVQSR